MKPRMKWREARVKAGQGSESVGGSPLVPWVTADFEGEEEASMSREKRGWRWCFRVFRTGRKGAIRREGDAGVGAATETPHEDDVLTEAVKAEAFCVEFQLAGGFTVGGTLPCAVHHEERGC
jgi:hypothetical protein